MSSTPNDETTIGDLYRAYDADGLDSPLFGLKGLDQQPLVFDFEGDLWIDVGGGDDGEPANRKGVYRFRVSSEAVGCASHVLEALVVGPWREQKPATTEDEKWVVALPDDHPVAMAALFAMMHHRVNSRVPKYPEGFKDRREVIWRILSAAEKYDVAHLLWVHGIDWPQQATSTGDSEDDQVHTLQGLNFLWRLGAVGLVEYMVRKIIYEITEPQLNALLAVADDPSIGLPISLRKLLLVVVDGREGAIQSALEFLYPMLEDPGNNMGDVAVWDPADVAAIEKQFGSRSERAELDCSPSNGTIATYKVSRMYKGSVIIPTKAKHVYVHVHTSVKHLLCVIEDALDCYYRPDRMMFQKYLDRCEANRRELWDFEPKLHSRWTHVEETWDRGYYVQKRRWNLDFESFQDWVSLDLNLSGRWMDRGSVLDSERLEWLQSRRSALHVRAKNWDMAMRAHWAKKWEMARRAEEAALAPGDT